MVKTLAALLAGLVFGAGLGLGGMTDPAVVLGFLDVFGDWNAQLVFVVGSAVVTTAIGYRWVLRRPKPLFDVAFQLPSSRALDARLISGAAIFGIGWGIAGYCPGPLLASLSGGATSTWLLLMAMLAGWWLTAYLLPVPRAWPVPAPKTTSMHQAKPPATSGSRKTASPVRHL